jgi:rare lipoprotein A
MNRLRRSVSLCGLWLVACTSGPHRATPPPPQVPVVSAPAPASPTVPAPVRAPASRPSDAELLALPDAVPRIEPRAAAGNPPFYEVYGQRYTVLPSAHGFVERGVASWYGPDFHGIATSTGEPYDMYAMTAAHKTLPLPAYVRVTNLRNGRTIVVRVNDRGPFKANRIIDLSYAAALKLDMVRDGTTLVEIQAEDPDGGFLGDAVPTGAALYAQVGAFGVLDNAKRLRDRLVSGGFAAVEIRSDPSGAKPIYRVRVGPVESVDAYDALAERLRRLGIDQVVLAPN